MFVVSLIEFLVNKPAIGQIWLRQLDIQWMKILVKMFCDGMPEDQPTTSSHQLRLKEIDHCPTRWAQSVLVVPSESKKNMLINKPLFSSHVSSSESGSTGSPLRMVGIQNWQMAFSNSREWFDLCSSVKLDNLNVRPIRLIHYLTYSLCRAFIWGHR